MVAKMEKLADEFEATHPEIAALLRADATVARKLGAPESFGVEKPEALSRVDLEKIVAGQVGKHIALGFHTEVYPQLSAEGAEEQYRKDFILPEGAAQPAEYVGRFDVALVVEPRISLTRKHELAKRIMELDLDSVARGWATSQVREWVNTGNIQDLTEHPTDKPYLVFTHDGQRYRPFTVKQAIQRFADDEVGNPQVEITDLFLKHPEYFVDHGIYAAGSHYGGGLVPCLGAFSDEPGVSADLFGSPFQSWGAGSRGKEYIILGA